MVNHNQSLTTAYNVTLFLAIIKVFTLQYQQGHLTRMVD